MAVDFDSLLFRPLFQVFGDATARIDLKDTAGPQDVRAIDRTKGVALPSPSQADQLTLRPVVAVRSADFLAAGLTYEGLAHAGANGADVTVNGKRWLIKSHMPFPGPQGEDRGEIYLIVMEPPE